MTSRRPIRRVRSTYATVAASALELPPAPVGLSDIVVATAEAHVVSPCEDLNTNVPTYSNRRNTKRKREEEPTIYAPPVTRRKLTLEERQKREAKRAKDAEEKLKRQIATAEAKEAKRLEKEHRQQVKEQAQKQKQEEKALKKAKEAEEAAVAAHQKQLKRMKKAEETAQKKAVKEAKETAKSSINKKSFTAFLKERGLTTSSTPESLTGLLDAARTFHLQTNGNATISTPSGGTTREHMDQLRRQITGVALGSVLAPFVQVPLVPPPSVHNERVCDDTPLSREQAMAQAREVIELESPVLTNTSNTNIDDPDVEDLTDDQDVMAGSILNVPNVLDSFDDDAELIRLQEEGRELERQLATVRQRRTLRNKNAELRKEIEEYEHQ